MRVQVAGDVDGERDLDRPVEKEEHPGEGDQTKQVGAAKESESRLGGPNVDRLRVDRLLGRRRRGVRTPRLTTEEGE